VHLTTLYAPCKSAVPRPEFAKCVRQQTTPANHICIHIHIQTYTFMRTQNTYAGANVQPSILYVNYQLDALIIIYS